MKKRAIRLASLALLAVWAPFVSGLCCANDLDDGITMDDGIRDYYRLKPDTNLRFIQREAIARSAGKKAGISTSWHPQIAAMWFRAG